MLQYLSNVENQNLILGLSTDIKPAATKSTDFFWEVDTGKQYWVNNGQWECATDKTYQVKEGSTGYSINVQALTSSPVDAATVYFGSLPKAPTTTANISKVYIRKVGTIKMVEIYCYSGTAGTSEPWSIYVRKNNTTDYLVATVASNSSERVFSNKNINIPVTIDDYIEIKVVNPTWVTNPLTCIFSGYFSVD